MEQVQMDQGVLKWYIASHPLEDGIDHATR
jgi:hypothetical protein